MIANTTGIPLDILIGVRENQRFRIEQHVLVLVPAIEGPASNGLARITLAHSDATTGLVPHEHNVMTPRTPADVRFSILAGGLDTRQLSYMDSIMYASPGYP